MPHPLTRSGRFCPASRPSRHPLPRETRRPASTATAHPRVRDRPFDGRRMLQPPAGPPIPPGTAPVAPHISGDSGYRIPSREAALDVPRAGRHGNRCPVGTHAQRLAAGPAAATTATTRPSRRGITAPPRTQGTSDAALSYTADQVWHPPPPAQGTKGAALPRSGDKGCRLRAPDAAPAVPRTRSTGIRCPANPVASAAPRAARAPHAHARPRAPRAPRAPSRTPRTPRRATGTAPVRGPGPFADEQVSPRGRTRRCCRRRTRRCRSRPPSGRPPR